MFEWGDDYGLIIAEGSNNTWDSYGDNSTVNVTSDLEEGWKPSKGLLLGIGIYLTAVGLVATVGNALFIVTVTRWRLMRSNAHMILLLNLAVCDLAISIVGYPYTTIAGYIGWWPFGDTMCILYGFLCFTFSQVSMNSLVAVSIFRYIAVCRPHKQHLLTSRLSRWAVCVSWVHALFWTATPLLGWSSYTFEPTGISCSLNWHDRSTSGITYTLGCTFFCYVTHVTALLWCYRKIFAKVHNLGFSRNWRQRQQQRMNVVMVLSFLVCWSPYAIVSVISIFNKNLYPIWYVFPTMFAKTSCMMNPILYGFTNKFLRKELLSVVKKCFGLTTPMEDFQTMRLRHQEGLYNKEGIFTGRNHCICTCDRCSATRRLVFPNAEALTKRALIDLYIRQQREKDLAEEAEELRIRDRPRSLNVNAPDNNGVVARSTSLNIPVAGRKTRGGTPSTASVPGTSTEDLKVLSLPELRLSGPNGSLMNLDHIPHLPTPDLPSNSKTVTLV